MSHDDRALLIGLALVVVGLVASSCGVTFGGLVTLFGVGVIWWSL